MRSQPSIATGVSRKIHRERVLMLGWAPAILMQLAHPLIARAIADHSGFRTSATAPWRRLHATVGAMLALTFGTDEDAARVAARINHVHDGVRGVLGRREGSYDAGEHYSARNPALLRWVHVTCVDAFLRTYELFVASLTRAERDMYCSEASNVERLLGIPHGMLPRHTTELANAVMDAEIDVTPSARELARDLLNPPIVRYLRPVPWSLRLAAVGLLPPAFRAAYGFSWDETRERRLRGMARVCRTLLPFVPSVVRDWPAARHHIRRADGSTDVAGPHSMT